MQENHIDRLESDSIDLRQIFRKTLPYWPWFLLAIGISLVAAFFLIKSAPEKYASQATILISKDGGSPSLDNLLLGNRSQTNMANEAGIIQSINLKKQALKYSNTGISYYLKNRYKTTEVYGKQPFRILFDSLHMQPVNVLITIEPQANKRIRITADKENALFYPFKNTDNKKIQSIEIDTVINQGEWIINKQLAFKIDSVDLESENGSYGFCINSLQKQISFYSELGVNIDKESTLMNLSLTTSHPKKAIDLLNGLIYAYQKSQVQKILDEKEESIKFIDHLLIEVSDTLATYENELTSFQTENLAVGIDAKSQDLYSKYSNIKTELSKISLQQRYYKHVEELLKKEKKITDLISPSALGINEPIINDLVMQLVDLYNQKTEIDFNTRKDNPMTNVITGKIENLKQSLELNIQNNLAALELSKEEHKEQLEKIETQLSKLPMTNKQLNAYERKFQIIDNLYTFLLKKRSEMRIEKSAIQPKNEVIQNATELTTNMIGRSPVQIILIAIMLALIIPFGIIQLKSVLFNRIEDETQIQRYSNISTIGHILRTVKNKDNVFAEPVSSCAEAFRTIRTNIHFFSADEETKIFLVTSTKQGEGKSFIARNLAKAFAYDNQKTILLNFDLRKPSSNDHGISTYLIDKAKIKDIIQKDDETDIIHSGPQPPNAGELINNYRTGELFQYLKRNYDKIVIDSPPLAPISDASVLSHYSDIQLFVIRLNYTPYELFKQTIKKPIFQNFTKPLFIINDIKPRNYYYSAYNYQEKAYSKSSHKKA